MAKKKASKQNVQLIVILAFFSFFIFWAMSKCNSMKEEYREKSAAEAIEEANEPTLRQQQVDTLKTVPEVRTIKERYTPLYVTIEGMNLRDKPQLNGRILNRLKLYEEVVFLNEVTDSIWEIDLGLITKQEPWVKVKCKKGHTGWVYGAGVSYYKKELKIE